jgi:hypothetical protein
VKFITVDQHRIIIDKYKNGQSSSSIARDLGFHPNTIIRFINKRCGHRPSAIQNSTYKIDRDYFSQIDSQDKAYWLGFIASDGYVQRLERSNGHVDHRLVVKLKRDDEVHLKKLLLCLNSTHPIKQSVVKRSKLVKNEFMCSRININCAELVRDLIKAGILEFKQSGVWPTIKESLESHFIRGLVDGDGWVSPARDGSLTIGYCSPTIEPVKRFAAILEIDNSITFHKGVWRISKSGIDCRRIGDALYSNATVYLERKFSNYFNFIQSLSQ